VNCIVGFPIAPSGNPSGWRNFFTGRLPIADSALISAEKLCFPVEKLMIVVYFMYKEYNNQNNKTEGDCIYALH
jgi:hypothetical protein